MAGSLSKLRKSELKGIAKTLGVSDGGLREDIADRIRTRIAQGGVTDPKILELAREESPKAGGRRSTESSRLASLSSANEDGDTSGTGSSSRSSRSSLRRRTVQESQGSSRADSDSDSGEDPLSEAKVRNFIEDVQSELHNVSEKVHSGAQRVRRASVDFGSSISHAIGGAAESLQSHGRESEGWCGRVCAGLKSHLSCSSGECSISNCAKKSLHRLQETGSTSTGLVWISFVFEFLVFMCAACSNYRKQNGESPCLGFLTNWPDFLLPFFSYYGSLFLIPTLLSQLFNVDKISKTRLGSGNSRITTGILSRTTTSGLSYFVFKFAVTYVLSYYHQLHLDHSAAGSSHLANIAKGAAETVGFGNTDHSCQCLGEVFRFVPAVVGLAISGAGTVLALAETIVSKRR
ncbi:hypothetical protein BGZ76_001252 [Entomortierella beljakovae]|nr:hypothetical protein BGZ76_001252 [Entomortierella beljakovae]